MLYVTLHLPVCHCCHNDTPLLLSYNHTMIHSILLCWCCMSLFIYPSVTAVIMILLCCCPIIIQANILSLLSRQFSAALTFSATAGVLPNSSPLHPCSIFTVSSHCQVHVTSCPPSSSACDTTCPCLHVCLMVQMDTLSALTTAPVLQSFNLYD